MSVVTVFVVIPVALLMTWMLAAGTPAPVGSVTTPVTAPCLL